jgi:glycosyltransferase involved in cell wall biosynthesis
MLIGYNPPQLEKEAKIEAAHYRTWQFLEPLVADGHQICLCANSNSFSQIASLPKTWSNQLTYYPIPFQRRVGWVGQLQQIHDDFQPDCIVAVNFDCCLSVTKLRTDKPIWMDIYGDYLTIIQVARYRVGSDRGIPTSIKHVQRVLRKGDIFSGCGTPQAHALVGELAMTGRLNSQSFGYEFVRVILPGANPSNGAVVTDQKRKSCLSTRGISEDSFVVLWCGGYNTWTDVDTLFAGLERAMSQNSNVHYVSVGANTYEAPDNVYTRLLNLIEKSPYRERFHMLGWRPWTEIAGYYRQSDVGLNIDALHYETIYGTRTRLIEMIAAGLPVITSLGCELSDLLGRQGAGLTFETGDEQGLSQQILTLAGDEELRQQMAQTALQYASQELSFATTTIPVRQWVCVPRKAPDRGSANLKTWLQHFEYQARSVLRQAIWQMVGLD